MTNRLQEVIDRAVSVPANEQDRVASMLLDALDAWDQSRSDNLEKRQSMAQPALERDHRHDYGNLLKRP